MIGDTITSGILQRALDGTWQKQRATANNIANHETPGYKAIKVDFERSLIQEVQKLEGQRLDGEEKSRVLSEIRNSSINTFKDNTISERADGNNVNLDAENVDMAKIQLQYQYLTRSMTDMFQRLRYAVSEGKK